MKLSSRIKHAVLSIPCVYRLLQRMLGSHKTMIRLVNDYIKLPKGAKVLDIGCGPAEILNYFSHDVEYYGFDMSEKYIQAASLRYGERGTFICANVTEITQPDSNFDVVLAIGILHHLNDDEAASLLQLAKRSLKKGGYLITLDGVYMRNQRKLSKFLLDRDRGMYVRTKAAYQALSESVFSNVEVKLIDDLIRLPYDHIIMRAHC